MQLVRPTVALRDKFVREIKDCQSAGFYINRDIALIEDDFNGFVSRLLDGNDVPEWFSKEWTTTKHSMFWVVADSNLVGIVNIRHELTEELLVYGGHIGLAIFPKYRRKGYATEALRLAFIEARNIGIDRALLTTDDSNVAIDAVNRANGLVPHDKSFNEDLKKVIVRWWVDIKQLTTEMK